MLYSGSKVLSEAVRWLSLCVAEACSNESLLSFILIFKVCYYLKVLSELRLRKHLNKGQLMETTAFLHGFI